jgi:hypothetical protein
MKPPPFEYLTADSVDAAVQALADSGGDGIIGTQHVVCPRKCGDIHPYLLFD